MTDTGTLYLIDGTAYIYRAYHAIRSLSNSSGMATNAVFGFTRMLIQLVRDRQPDYLGMCFDAKGPTFRHDLYPEYKANRPPMPEDMAAQIPWIKKVTRGFNIPIIEKEGFEADDIMGTLALKASRQGHPVVLVTGDKDFIQLVDEGIRIWDPMKDKTIDLGTVRDTHGLEPRQMIEVMGLSGDTSDNVPGVPGIGPKTAVALIRDYRSMENLYERIDELKGKRRENLETYRDQAFLSRQLVTIRTDAPVDVEPAALKVSAPDPAVLGTLFKELEFRQLQQAFTEDAVTPECRYEAITDETALRKLMASLASADIISVDTETTSQNPIMARLVGISISDRPETAAYIPCGHDPDLVPGQIPMERVLDIVRPVLENPAVCKVGQNIKYDWIVFARHGVDLQGVCFDTMLASYLLNPSKRSHGLDQIALDFLGRKTISFSDVAGKGKSAVTFDRVPLSDAVPYACEDADVTLAAYHTLSPQLEPAGLDRLMETVELPLVPVLGRMEMAGIAVDRDHLIGLSKDFDHQLVDIEERIYALAGERFNIKSSQQLGAILFEKMGLPVQKKTRKKTGYSTDVDVLNTLAPMHELPAMVLRHRTLAKLKSTYTDALLELIHPETGRIHTSFNQTVTATGRLSSSDPNLQNIPIRTEEGRRIREAFVTEAGWRLVSADYSQIELRLLAHYAGDERLISAFEEDDDIHRRTAAEVFEMMPELVTEELRRQAKVINFGIIYGMSPFGLSKSLGISQKMAKTYIDHYFGRYRGVKRYIDETVKTAHDTRQTSTLLGRIRLLPEIDSSNHNIRQFAERTAINTPIQGTAADLIKLAMIRVDDAFGKSGSAARMLLSVHDEIVFEVPDDECESAMARVREIMESVWELKVPLKVNMASGKNWAEIH